VEVEAVLVEEGRSIEIIDDFEKLDTLDNLEKAFPPLHKKHAASGTCRTPHVFKKSKLNQL